MKSFIAILSLVCTFGILQAQTNSFYIGATVGGNNSQYKFTEDLQELYPNSNTIMGLNGGFDLGLKFDNWTLSSGLHYAQKGAEYQTDNFDSENGTAYFTGREKLHFITIPVLLGYRENLTHNVGWTLAIGPSFNFGLGGKIDETTEFFGSDEVDFQNYKVQFGQGVNDDYKSTQIGFQLSPGLFVKLNEKSTIKFNATWDFGTSDMFSERYKKANDFFDTYKGNQVHRNAMFTIGYEYHFGFEDKY